MDFLKKRKINNVLKQMAKESQFKSVTFQLDKTNISKEDIENMEGFKFLASRFGSSKRKIVVDADWKIGTEKAGRTTVDFTIKEEILEKVQDIDKPKFLEINIDDKVIEARKKAELQRYMEQRDRESNLSYDRGEWHI